MNRSPIILMKITRIKAVKVIRLQIFSFVSKVLSVIQFIYKKKNVSLYSCQSKQIKPSRFLFMTSCTRPFFSWTHRVQAVAIHQ